MQCPNCRNDAPDGEQACPTCGTPLEAQPNVPPSPDAPAQLFSGQSNEPVMPPKSNALAKDGLAIACLVAATVLFFIPIIGPIIGLALTIIALGIIALNRINRSQGGKTGKGLAIAGIVVSGLGLFCAPTLLSPMFGRAREKARQTICMNNQKQIAIATRRYVQDHEGRYPKDGFWALLAIDPGVLRCHEAPSQPIGYSHNGNLLGRKATEAVDQSTVVLTADGNGAAMTTSILAPTRHGGGFIAGFADGHVECSESGTALSLSATPPVRRQ
jgi:prepilin-type processing-associated H-X9-DG protein